MAARMVPGKDFETFFAAARALHGRSPGDWQFVALGEGPHRETYIRTTLELQRAGALIFPEPSIEVLPEVLRADACALLCVPELHQEGCSNAILEYMACGKATICTNAGGNPELIKDELTGFLISPQDTSALVSVLGALRENPEHARTVGTRALSYIRTWHSPQRMASQYQALYARLLADRPSCITALEATNTSRS